ncbi:hypothetical protein FF36_04678 [Frankia torreyi]|uniref:Uncharacterized protein n=1 Tax=Frankia torreyi TaxID=1856 RepID=A0A0D8BC82_9ACTN|nr:MULTISPECIES: hypothetical protein [unclassified Frankia]KJE20997.1 hypothetical protein FF36_04678 [Frankia torreyi]KQM03888.1 hypothetical protein FF86_103334 [Frankia sp. CpI1-P]
MNFDAVVVGEYPVDHDREPCGLQKNRVAVDADRDRHRWQLAR